MDDLETLEAWFVTGSQHLYGPEALQQVADHSRQIAQSLSDSPAIAVRVVFKPVLTTPEDIRRVCLEANADERCVGLIAWMHTFSPAKMWIAGLQALNAVGYGRAGSGLPLDLVYNPGGPFLAPDQAQLEARAGKPVFKSILHMQAVHAAR